MDNVKPWQIILIVVAVGALGFSLWRQGSKPKVDLPNSVLVVDVTNGDLYRMKLGKRNGAYFPERHPDTGDLTLMPVEQDEAGEWYIVGHAMAALQDIKEEIKVVNTTTGKVTIESDEVLRTLQAGG